jgi:hypothetical protein
MPDRDEFGDYRLVPELTEVDLIVELQHIRTIDIL